MACVVAAPPVLANQAQNPADHWHGPWIADLNEQLGDFP
jgi:hypothetical protein